MALILAHNYCTAVVEGFPQVFASTKLKTVHIRHSVLETLVIAQSVEVSVELGPCCPVLHVVKVLQQEVEEVGVNIESCRRALPLNDVACYCTCVGAVLVALGNIGGLLYVTAVAHNGEVVLYRSHWCAKHALVNLVVILSALGQEVTDYPIGKLDKVLVELAL